MRPSLRLPPLPHLLSVLLAGACLPGAASAADEPVTSVEVAGIRNPEMRSYRGISAGLDTFDELHKLAPNAPGVRFRFISNKHDTAAETGLQLRIAGKSDPTYLAPDDTGQFTVPRIAAAYDDDADVILNRKADAYRSEVVVRTPGLAPDVLRLGDLRLNCQVTVAIIKHEVGFMVRTAITGLLRRSDWCTYKDLQWGFPMTTRVRSAYMEEGNRSAKVNGGAWNIQVLLGDPSWSDEALIHLKFAPPAPTADKPAQFDAQTIYLRGTMDKWGTANALAKQADGSYRVEIALTKGKHSFKVGSSDFEAIDFGARSGHASMTTDTGNQLTWGGNNLSFMAAEAGTYAFTVNVADPVAPQLTVTRLQ